jgi:2-hydroxychromene-2-carboxylate isomerase
MAKGGTVINKGRTPRGSDIEFWFDFASGYAYFGALEIDALAARHGRQVLWRPFTLGSAFKVTGATGLSRTPLKKDYAQRDWSRLARLKGVPFNPPPRHPQTGMPAIRAFYYVDGLDRAKAATFARDLILAYFKGEVSTDDADAVAQFAGCHGFEAAAVRAGLENPDIKQRAREIGEAAISRGVFGSPWIFVDDEPFWGSDRLGMVEEWLSRGPW